MKHYHFGRRFQFYYSLVLPNNLSLSMENLILLYANSKCVLVLIRNVNKTLPMSITTIKVWRLPHVCKFYLYENWTETSTSTLCDAPSRLPVCTGSSEP